MDVGKHFWGTCQPTVLNTSYLNSPLNLFEHHIPSLLICFWCVGRRKCDISSMPIKTLWLVQLVPLSVLKPGFTWIAVCNSCYIVAELQYISHFPLSPSCQSDACNLWKEITSAVIQSALIHHLSLECFKSKDMSWNILLFCMFYWNTSLTQ